MPTPVFLGDFEHLVLLGILDLGDEAAVLDLRDHLNTLAKRTISRGALYRTLERLETKGWVAWRVDASNVPERGGHPRRLFRVTDDGVATLQRARATLVELWEGLEGVFT